MTVEDFVVGALSIFVMLILLVCPGMFLVFLLPSWLGLPLAVAIAMYGTWKFARFGDDTLGTRFTR